MTGAARLTAGRGEKARVAIAAGLALAGLTVLSAMLLVWNDRQEQIQAWRRNVDNMSTTLAAHTDQTFRAADLVLLSIQALVYEQNVHDATDLARLLGTRAVHDALRHKIGGVPQLAVASIVDITGRVVNYSRGYPVPPIQVEDRDYFKPGLALPPAGLYISAPTQNRGNGEWTFYLVRPISVDNKPIGIVLAGVETRFFDQFYDAVNPGDYSAIGLSRSDGVPLLPSAKAAGHTDAGESSLQITASRTARSYPLVTTVTASDVAVLGHWRRTARTVELLTFGLLSALLWLTLALARLFDRHDGTIQELKQKQQEANDSVVSNADLLEELRTSQTALLDKSRVLELTLEHIDQGLMMVAADRSVPVCNRRAMELLELPRSLMVSRPSFERVVEHQHSIGEFAAGIVRAPSCPGSATMVTERQSYERTRPNGAILEIQTIPLPDGGMVRTFTDITARRRSEEQVRYFAHHDGLTRLANRTVFQAALTDAIDHAARTSQRLAVHYIDLDGFKLINDTHGHAVGDCLLVEVATRLRSAVRDGDLVGRMGGDEFAILQPLSDPSGAEQLAERILAIINEPYAFGDLQCAVGLSVGVALFPDHASSPEALMRGADFALYRAKADGKGAVCMFDKTMDRRQQYMFQLEQDLKLALAENQFFVEYQPIVDAASREPVYFEALLRWRHPTRGVVRPGEFVGLAERCGLIVPLGLWILETACREATQWPADVGLAVNVSPVQFSRGDLPSQVAAVLGRTGLAAHRLTLEVTEGVLLEETSDVRDAMASLRALGVRFSLDDFGTAQSRLSYLHRFPFDVIKIDRSFIEDAVDQDGSRAIVGAVLAIGRAFRLRVVGEGVEREDQLQLLRSMGCELVQGYLTGRPQRRAALPQFAYIDGT